jgi:molecular chaperone GrpE
MSTKRKKKKETDATEPKKSASADDDSAEQTVEEKDPARIDQELAELKERLQRLSADYQNYQKRAHRQTEQARQLAKEEMAKGLLSVLDNFEHALRKGQGADDVAAVLEGVRIVYDHLLNVLVGEGLKRIEVEAGASFDPNLHQAMLHETSSEFEDNTVMRELASGYVMNERTLRPAMVSVVKAVPQPAEETDESATEAGHIEPADQDESNETERKERQE